MKLLKNKLLWLGVGVVLAAVFIWEALSGQMGKNTSVFNPASYR